MYSLFLVLLCATSTVQAYGYTCYPNNTIDVTGLPNLPNMTYFAIQSDGTNCTVTGDPAAGTAQIDGCLKDQEIHFTFSSYEDMLEKQIQGGLNVEILNITCYEIPFFGVPHTIARNLTATIAFDEDKILHVAYNVTSSLNASIVDVGDSVEWTIFYPASYTLEITSCTAYPGTTISTSNSVLLIQYWCSTEDFLITDFTESSTNDSASAVISAFKFYASDNVYLECNLKVCPAVSNCSTSCSSRKKRDLSLSDESPYHATIGTVLHINDPEMSSAIKHYGFGLMVMTLFAIVIYLL